MSDANVPQPINSAHAPKLTQWKNEPSAAALTMELEASKPAHDVFVLKIQRWRDNAKVEGAAKPKKVKGRSSVQPKLIRRQAEWRYSALTEPFNSSDKLFDVKPVTFEDVAGARQNEFLLNWQFRTKLNRVALIDTYVRATVDEGASITRVGWNRVTKIEQQEVPVWSFLAPQSEEELQPLMQAMQLKLKDPRTYDETVPEALKQAVAYAEETGQPSVAVQTGTEVIDVEVIVDNRPVLQNVNPENFYFDPSCGDDLDKAGFIVISFETSQAELKKQGNYKNLEHVNWEGATTVADPNHRPNSTDSNFNFTDALRKRIVAYEYWGYWDVHGDGILVPIVATWIGGVMVRLEENPFPDGKPPFVVTPYMPLKREVMGESDAELLEDNQKILGATTRGVIDLLGRSANGQQGFAKGMLDVVNRRRYESGQDYEFNPNIPPDAGIKEHKYPEIPQSALMVMQLQNQEAEALTGVKAFSGGLSGEAFGQVATGIRGVLDAAAKREMAILRRLADGLVKIGRKIIAMNAVFLSEEEVIRVTNEQFVTIKREELAGDYDLIVDISTAEVDNSKSQDLAFMLQTLGPNGDFNMVKIILAEIARLKRMPELEHKIKEFEPQPDPMQQKLLELQIQREQMEIAKLQSEIMLNQAKTLKEQTTAEKTALDTVEQESGTTHARNLEHQIAQSTGNQNLEVTKALLKPKKPEETKPHIEAAIGFNELIKRMRDPRNSDTPPINNIMDRDIMAQTDPRLSLSSGQFEPGLDPALNPAINI